jgi:hypothetical protein
MPGRETKMTAVATAARQPSFVLDPMSIVVRFMA